MLQMLRDDHIRQISGAPDIAALAETAVLQQHICPDLPYNAYNEAIKAAAAQFGLSNACFATHGARIGAAMAQFVETKDISAIKLAGGWKSQNSVEQYIRNGRAEIAALDITPNSQNRMLKFAEKFTKRMNRYIANHEYTTAVGAKGLIKPYCFREV